MSMRFTKVNSLRKLWSEVKEILPDGFLRKKVKDNAKFSELT